MADSQVSLGASLTYGWDLLRAHWREIWGALALNALAWTVLFAGVFAQNGVLILAGLPAMILTKYAVYGSVVRLAFGAEHHDDADYKLGVLGLQWKRMELRMFGADLLFTVFFAVVISLLMIVLVAPLVGIVMSHGAKPADIQTQEQMLRWLGPDGQAILRAEQVLVQVVAIVLVGIGVRLSLTLPASAESGKIAVLRTWKVVRRAFWRLLGASLVIILPLMVILMLIMGSVAGADGQLGRFTPTEAFVFALVCGLWAGGAITPLLAAVQAYFYKHLKAADQP